MEESDHLRGRVRVILKGRSKRIGTKVIKNKGHKNSQEC